MNSTLASSWPKAYKPMCDLNQRVQCECSQSAVRVQSECSSCAQSAVHVQCMCSAAATLVDEAVC